MKWLKKRILPLFGSDQTVFLPVLARIELNDASLYEEVAMSQATSLIAHLFSYYKTIDPKDFLVHYCDHFITQKQQKLLQWKKFYCTACHTGDGKPMELNGQLEWNKHVKTRKHQSQLKKRRKFETGLSDKEYYSLINASKVKLT